MSPGPFISRLDLAEAGNVGAKAWNLHILSKAGCPVPLTYCVTIDAYRDFMRENGLESVVGDILRGRNTTPGGKSKSITNSIMNGGMPVALRGELESHGIFSRADKKWAVRSSSNMEDLEETSFAGLYDSHLNVQGTEEILHSIKKCWASLWSERALVYRERCGLDHMRASMAVMLQEMVDAVYSGVIFTQKPHPFQPTRMYLEYCEGLGDRLVAGTLTPFACEFERPGGTVLPIRVPGNGGLGNGDLKALYALAVRIEERRGLPQDIEWAKDGERIHILQARPIARKKPHVPLDGTWTRANIGEVLPDVVTPLTWDVFRATLCNGASWDEADLEAADRNGIRRFHGRAYLRLDSFLNAFCYLPSVNPLVVTKALGLNLPADSVPLPGQTGPVIRLAQSAFLLDSAGILPRIRRMVERIPSPPPPAPDKIPDLLEWTSRCFRIHMKCTAYAVGTFGLLRFILGRWLPGEAEDLLPEILTGRTDMQTAAQGISLADLAIRLRNRPHLRAIFEEEKTWSGIEGRLSVEAEGREILVSCREFLEKNGARAAKEFELAVPRWREDPAFVCGILRNLLRSEPGDIRQSLMERRRRRQDAVDRIASSFSPARRVLVSRLLSSHGDYTTYRENVKYRLMEGYASLREAFLTAGKGLAARGMIDGAEDVFFLGASEALTGANENGTAERMRASVSSRKAQHALWQAVSPPDILRFEDAPDIPTFPGKQLQGIGCSPGVAEGLARVLSDISGSDRLEAGEILVAPHTDPGWTPLFLNCGAVVTEIGGFLSHGATVAREYGIPAVVNVAGATRSIRSGDYIRVDGTRGLITIGRGADHAADRQPAGTRAEDR